MRTAFPARVRGKVSGLDPSEVGAGQEPRVQSAYMDLANRTGAQRRSEIPPAVLTGLNAGELESVNLVEWLAIDMPTLLRHVAPQVGLAAEAAALGAAADALAGLGVVKREKGIGAAALASHTSDMVRSWAAFMLLADERLTQPERLAATRRFAADPAVGVRECAWDSFRPYLVQDLSAGLALLEAWVHDPDPNVRRFASEVTRPRGVWTPHIPALKDNPQQALGLLEPLKSDPSRYVQNSVANWLNDASKSQPDWVQAICARWIDESPTKETRYIVKRALRTLRKQGIVAA